MEAAPGSSLPSAVVAGFPAWVPGRMVALGNWVMLGVLCCRRARA